MRRVAPSPIELPLTTAPLVERERADARRNRERILCAAARLVDEHGIDAVSMDDVAAAAGVGKGTLYRRFGDRWTLLRALIEEPERDFQDQLIRGAPPLGPGAPPRERLRAYGAGQLELLERHARFMLVGEKAMAGRLGHPVYAFYRTHVALPAAPDRRRRRRGAGRVPRGRVARAARSGPVPLPARGARHVAGGDDRGLAGAGRRGHRDGDRPSPRAEVAVPPMSRALGPA